MLFEIYEYAFSLAFVFSLHKERKREEGSKEGEEGEQQHQPQEEAIAPQANEASQGYPFPPSFSLSPPLNGKERKGKKRKGRSLGDGEGREEQWGGGTRGT